MFEEDLAERVDDLFCEIVGGWSLIAINIHQHLFACNTIKLTFMEYREN